MKPGAPDAGADAARGGGRLAALEAAQQRKNAMGRKKREEAELRMLWEQESDRCHVLQMRIAENDRRIATLNKQADTEAQEQQADLERAMRDKAKWAQKIVDTERALTDKRDRREKLRAELAELRRQQNEVRLGLVDLFVRRDVSPIRVDDAVREIEGHGKKNMGEQLRAAARRPDVDDEDVMDPAVAAALKEASSKQRRKQVAPVRAALEEAAAELRQLEQSLSGSPLASASMSSSFASRRRDRRSV